VTYTGGFQPGFCGTKWFFDCERQPGVPPMATWPVKI